MATAWHEVRGRRLLSRYAASEPEHASPQVVLVYGQVVSTPRLGVYFPVAAPDRQGFGRSDKPRYVLTIPELADALADWLEGAGIGRAVL